MRICYGWSRKPLNLSLEQRYHPEQLINRLGPFFPHKSLASPLVWMPVWIHMDNQYVRLNSKEEIELACRLACIYHNGPDNRAPFCEDDGDWQNVTRGEALLATCQPETASSDDEDDGECCHENSLIKNPALTPSNDPILCPQRPDKDNKNT
jgi:hypothetical protein